MNEMIDAYYTIYINFLYDVGYTKTLDFFVNKRLM
jgi:hypothetical protein